MFAFALMFVGEPLMFVGEPRVAAPSLESEREPEDRRRRRRPRDPRLKREVVPRLE